MFESAGYLIPTLTKNNGGMNMHRFSLAHWRRTFYLACFAQSLLILAVLATSARAQELSDQTLFLNIHLENDQVELNSATLKTLAYHRPKIATPSSPLPSLAWQILDQAGNVLGLGSVIDPLTRHYETGSANPNGQLEGGVLTLTTNDLLIKMPWLKNGHRVNFQLIRPAGVKVEKKSLGTIGFEEISQKLHQATLRTEPPAPSIQVETLKNSGDPANRINIVFVGDGYRAEDQALLSANAIATMNFMFAEPSLALYENYFNVYLVHVTSEQAGCDRPNENYYVNTALDCTHDSTTTRLITVNYSKANQAAANAPAVDQVMVIANDANYGGSGSTNMAVFYNGSSMKDVGLHEFGHSYGLLADEYDYGYSGCYSGSEPSRANITIKTSLDTIKWALWIEPGTPISHVDSGTGNLVPGSPAGTAGVGLFQGAYYYTCGIYRPKANCLMKALGQPLCEVCREEMIKRAYDQIQLITSHQPESTSLNLPLDTVQEFKIEALAPSGSELQIDWYLDSRAIDGQHGESWQWTVTGQPNSQHIIRVKVQDSTSMIRKSSDGRASEEFSWTVNIGGSNRAPVANAGPDQATTLNQSVTLDGSGSADPDLDTLRYLWSQLTGPQNATISDPSAVQTLVSFPSPGDYTFQLVVNDGSLSSPADTVMVSVSAGSRCGSTIVTPTGTGSNLALSLLLLGLLGYSLRRKF
jgi:hypothetical protein